MADWYAIAPETGDTEGAGANQAVMTIILM